MTAPPRLAHDRHTPAQGRTVSYHSPMAPKLRKISRSALKVKTAKLPAKKLAQHAPQTPLLVVSSSRCVPDLPESRPSAVHRIFLLSPANASGVRARLILRENATFPLALRLRDGWLVPRREFFLHQRSLFSRQARLRAGVRAASAPCTGRARRDGDHGLRRLASRRRRWSREKICAKSLLLRSLYPTPATVFLSSVTPACSPMRSARAARSSCWAASLRQNTSILC